MKWTVPEIPLPPRAVRNQDDDIYIESAIWSLNKLSRLVALHRDMRIVDVGCAAGRLALPLLEFLDSDAGGSYEGIDINPDAIAWAQDHIESTWPNFHFRHVDVRHPAANPLGRLSANDVDLQLRCEEYDVAMLHSVYTHLIGPTIKSYTKQIAQALVPGGYLYLTLFEWDEEAESSHSAGTCPWDFAHDLEAVRVVDPDQPTFAVAVKSEFLSSVMDANGLRPEAESRGRWRTGNKNAQDIRIYRLRS